MEELETEKIVRSRTLHGQAVDKGLYKVLEEERFFSAKT